jgi:hypothetical protein
MIKRIVLLTAFAILFTSSAEAQLSPTNVQWNVKVINSVSEEVHEHTVFDSHVTPLRSTGNVSCNQLPLKVYREYRGDLVENLEVFCDGIGSVSAKCKLNKPDSNMGLIRVPGKFMITVSCNNRHR